VSDDAASDGARTEDNDLTRWLTAVLAEYQSLRTESLQAQRAQQTILQYGMTGVAILIGLALQLEAELLAILLLLYMVPLLTIVIIIVWFTEIFRSIRAGNFIAALEEKVNRVLGGNALALEWESWLRTRQGARMFIRDHMSFASLYTLNLAGLVLACYLAASAGFDLDHPAWVVSGFAVVHVGLLVFGGVLYRRYHRRVHTPLREREAAAQTR
jgi:positive regulator of sigma E activity